MVHERDEDPSSMITTIARKKPVRYGTRTYLHVGMRNKSGRVMDYIQAQRTPHHDRR